ncbi:Hypothetical predicted protein, partial [Prunus dulcis]
MGDGRLVTDCNEEPRACDSTSRNSLGGTPFCGTYLSGTPSTELPFAELPQQNSLLLNSLGGTSFRGTLFDRLEIRKLWRFLLGGLEVFELADIGKFDHPKTFGITSLYSQAPICLTLFVVQTADLVKVADGVSLVDTE